VNRSLGGNGITTGDEVADAQIVIDDINRHGGVLGRQLVPLFFSRDAQSAAPVADQANTECSFYTQDHHVFAVLLGNGPVDWAVKPCLNRVGVPTITSHIVSLDDGDPTLARDVDVSGMSESHLATAMMGALSAEHWFTPWNSSTGAPGKLRAKVGVVAYDIPAVSRALQQVVLPELRRLGYPADPNDVRQIPVPQATSDDARTEAALQNAMLRLRNDHVDHVVLVDNGGAMTLLFANNAYSQRYLPRYAGTSSNGFQALLDGGDIQKAVMNGAVGAGWEPVIDLPYTSDGPGAFTTPARKACLALMTTQHQAFSDSNAEAVALGYCDKGYFLRKVLTLAGSPTWTAYLNALDRLDSAFAPARGLGSKFAPGWHDGGAAYYDYVFNQSCGCMGYRGARHAVS
jgi:ABC-type branched-subunit amino acid transport system substrate-binding protein